MIGVPYTAGDLQAARNNLMKECTQQDHINTKLALREMGVTDKADVDAALCKIGEAVPITKGDALVRYLLKMGRDTTQISMEEASPNVADASEAKNGK